MESNASTTYVVSPFLQTVSNSDSAVIWHSLFGYPKIISLDTLKFLHRFSTPATIKSQLEKDPNREECAAIDELQRSYFLNPSGFDEREFLGNRTKDLEREITTGSLINYLGLIMSEACNFRCSYCIHFQNLETSDRIHQPKKIMPFEIAREAIDNFLAVLRQHGKRLAEINFGGGEPLLAWAVIKRVLEYCRDNYSSEFEFRFSLNTNASLMTPEIVCALKEYKVEVASSLDGLQKGNDQVRITKSGKPTYSTIVRGFEILAQANHPLDGIAVTVTGANFPLLDESIIDWALAHNMHNVRIDIDVIELVEIHVETIVEKLMRIRRYGERVGVDVPGFWSRPVENLNESILEGRGGFCGGVRGNSLCVNPAGKIYYCGYSVSELGSIPTFESFFQPDAPYHQLVTKRLAGTMKMCQGCMIEAQCGGGCHITQEYATATETSKILRMCDFYRRMTQEILLDQLKLSADHRGSQTDA